MRNLAMNTLVQLTAAPSGIAGRAAAAPTLAAKAQVEYRDLESRSILNHCDSPRMPFSWTINPYRGCEFGCQYCYARYTHEYMEFDAQAFEQKIFVKQGAGAILRRELARGKGRTGHEHRAYGQPHGQPHGQAHGQAEYGRGGIAIGTAT